MWSQEMKNGRVQFFERYEDPLTGKKKIASVTADKFIPLPDDRKARIQDKYLTRLELRAVLDAMKISKWRLLTEFLALSGLRIGEAMALTNNDVDMKALTIQVVGRRLTPHALRHTITSLFAEAGVSLEVISRRLGHADSDITRQIYFHVTKDLEKADAAAVSNVCFLR